MKRKELVGESESKREGQSSKKNKLWDERRWDRMEGLREGKGRSGERRG